MQSFAPGFLLAQSIPQPLVATLRLLGEYKGKQDLFKQQSPEVLNSLRRTAVIESVESSTRLEGAVIPNRRVLEGIVERGLNPSYDRSEQEIAGYRDVLRTIHDDHPHIGVTPGVIRQLHRDLFRYLPAPGGSWKVSDNAIVQTQPDGTRQEVFLPVSAFDTPRAMEELCGRLAGIWAGEQVDHLLVVATFVFDFLCVHPFLDGNGRMARLLSLLLLYKAGYDVGRYISLEKIVEATRDGYYGSLRKSSAGWHAGEHSLLPWWEYFLGVVVLGAYRSFEARVTGSTLAPGAKSGLVVQVVNGLPTSFSYADVANACPGVSRPTINRALADLRNRGLIRCVRRGRYSIWQKQYDHASASI
jgi:Fic family protein